LGDVTIELTTTLDSNPNDESIGVDALTVETDISRAADAAANPCVPTEPIDIDAESWGHDGCNGWSEKTCGEYSYWGGKSECGRGSTLTSVLADEDLGGAGTVDINFRLWTIDSWDHEWAYIKVKDQDGNVLA
jgi:hypothetical protein